MYIDVTLLGFSKSWDPKCELNDSLNIKQYLSGRLYKIPTRASLDLSKNIFKTMHSERQNL